jgi:serine/threonine protein kinase
MSDKDSESKKTTQFKSLDDTKATVRFEKELFKDMYGRAVAAAAAEPGSEDKASDENGESAYVIGGRYALQEGLAMGGQGAVYKVVHLALRKHFALKIIHPGRSADYETLRSFDQEIQVLSRLDHPNIVQVTDFGLDERFGVYLVMEYLRGETLLERLARDGLFNQRTALRVALQIAEGLRHLHKQDIIHRDIKPENIFLCRVEQEGRRRTLAKIIDFGLARPLIDDAEVDESERAGTPEFAAPEQFQGAGPVPSMDIYALGVLLFEMVTGQMAFEGTPEEVVKRKMLSPPPSPADRLDRPLDPNITRLITRVMAVDPAVRPQSIGDFIHELRAIADSLEPGGRGFSRDESVLHTVTAEYLASGSTEPLEAPDGASSLSYHECPVPTCVVGPDREVVSANEPFSDLVCLPVTQVAGTPLSDTLLSAVYPEVDQDLKEALQTGAPTQRRLKLDSSAGQLSTAHVWLVPFKPDPNAPFSIWFSILMAP